MIGYVYENTFTVFDLAKDQLKKDNYSRCNYEFKITLNRQMNTSFTLIVTTNEALEQGAFSISVTGPSKVSMKRIGTKFYVLLKMIRND